ncbi:hypothetical protein IWW57_003250, partial [Coemansia sp. S610]
MAHVDTSSPRSRLPRAPMTSMPGIGRFPSHQLQHSSSQALASGLAKDAALAHAPNKDKSATFVYCHSSGSTLLYLESMLKQLALKYPEHTLNYGVVLRDHTLHPRDRIRVNGEPVDSSVFELCSSECKKRLEAEGSRICQPGCSFAEKLDTMVVSIALHVFNRLNVTAIAISMPHTPTLPTQAPNAAAAAAASESSSDAATLCLEQLVMEIFCPKIVICGFEPLPSYADSLPEEWRKSLIYLMRRSVHVISTSQPKPVRVQLLSLTKIFGLTIEL